MNEETHEHDGIEEIAIIGLTGRFPGADSPEALWDIVKEGRETISRFSARSDNPDYVPARGILSDATAFDAELFGVTPNEALITDPQQRVFLQAAWAALENAGVDPKRYPGSIGVYAGMTNNSYHNYAVRTRPDLTEAVGALTTMMGNEKDYLATRVAYKLNLKGPAISVYTACSTSLVAVCQAVSSLLSYQCDVAIAGGVSVTFPQETGYQYQEGGILSPDGHCRSFDEKASGTVFSQGYGAVVLKRLSEARKDGDTIHAIIKSGALNNDGHEKVSFTAPSIDGQAEAITLAHALAGVEPEGIGYVEAHATATSLGDPIEVAGLTKAFRSGTERQNFCALGALKSNIGHLDAAAGIAGLIKTVQVLKNQAFPPVAHFTAPNPKLNLETSPFFVPAQLTPWTTETGEPRRAGVSSFGVGGTNAHVILEEAPELAETSVSRASQLLVLSAKTSAALERATDNLAAYLEANPALCLADAAYTLATGRQELEHRRIVSASAPAEAVTLLRNRDKKRVSTAKSTEPAIAFLFPGQGAQTVNMGRGLYESEPAFRDALDACAEILRMPLGFDLREVLYPTPENAAEAQHRLTETWITQPALFTVEYATAKLWEAWGITPAAMLGHSVGEYVAACLAGVFTLEDGLTLLATRARLMADMSGGSMLAVRLPESELAPRIAEPLAIAAINATGLCVVSGPTEAIEAFEQALETEKIAARRLPTSHAFHSSMMDGVLPAFREKLRATPLHAPTIPYVSSLTGTWIEASQATDPEYWCRQLREAVRFTDGVATLLEDTQRLCLEVGPGQTLTALVRQHPAKADTHAIIGSLPASGSERSELGAFQDALGQLWTRGITPNWDAYFAEETRRKIPLPTYSFEKTVYEIKPEPNVSTAQPVPNVAPTVAAEPIVPAASVAPKIDRRVRLVGELTDALQNLSGISADHLPSDATFLELGFDSLFLTQIGTAFQKKFGVKVTFRQLVEDFPSISDLAGHLDRVLPADPEPDPIVAAMPPPPPSVGFAGTGVPANTAPIAVISAIPGSAIEQVVHQQLALMQQQLELLRGVPTTSAPIVAAVADASTFPIQNPRLLGSGGTNGVVKEAAPTKAAFGPYKPLDKSSSTLTDKQQLALNSLIERYVARMPGSKRVTQEGRQRLADPRAVAGFKAAWKEMVFPVVTERSEGAKLWDVDGNEFVDITLGFGTNFLGHRPKFVVEALEKQLALGIEIGPQSAMAAKVAEKICSLTGMERAAFCNTGSEAVTAAIRMARTVSGRDRIALFSGAYHGQFDEVLVRAAGSRSLPVAPGIPDSMVENVLVLEYGTEESLQVIREQAHTLAAVLIEPVQSRRPEFQPAEFARELRKITEESGTALVFDEVVTGFRTHQGGMQARWGVRADLATYGKVAGGGFPIGIVTGKAEYMDALDGGFWSFGDDSAPEVGMTFFAGTFVRHPLALAAANAVLDHLIANPQLQSELDAKTEAFVNRLNARFEALGAGARLNRFSSMFFLQLPDSKLAGLMFYHLRLRGVHLWEGRPGFLSTVHTDEDIAFVERVFEESVLEMQEAGFLPCDRPKLSEAQREVWLAARSSEGASCALNESLSLKLTGPLDIARLESALNTVVARHDALRTTFSAIDGTPTVHATLTVPLQRNSESIGEGEGGVAFDLENGPLVRAYLVENGPESHTLVLSAHHIVCDGWSFGIVIHEMAVLYGGDNLPTAPSYGEYARRLEAESTPETQEYWKNLLTPTPPTLNLPTDRPHPTQRTFAGSRVERVLEPEILAEVKALSTKRGATLYTTLLTACGVLLHRLTGQTDIVLGSPAAGQATESEQGLVGHCVHLLPLRLNLEPKLSFTEQLTRTRTLVLDSFEYPAVTFGELVQALNLPREAGRVPLVGATFNLDKEELPAHIGTVKMTMEKNPRQFFQFDLGFNLVENEAGMVIEANYNADILDAETVQRWLNHFATLLAEIVKAPETALANLALLTETQEAALLSWGLGAQNAYPTDKSITTVFAEQVQKSPDAIAVAMGTKTLTYAEVDVRAKRVARNLLAQGVSVGDRVIVALERTPDLIAALVGVLQAGAAYVPLDPGYPEERKQLILADAGATVTIDSAWLAGTKALEALPLPAVDIDALAYVMYTSGSTGVPKGVSIPHQAILRLVQNCDYAPLTSSDVVAQVATPAFDAATFEFWGALLNGARLEILPRDVTLDLKRFAQTLSERKISALFLTTALFNELAREVPDAFASLTYLLFGGEAVSPRHVQAVLKAGGPKHLLHVYGPTEATTFATYFEVTEVNENSLTVPIGRPIANTTSFVLDDRRALCPVGVPGELFLGGPGLAEGYLGDAQKTAERFVEHARFGRLYKTGDLVRWNAEGYIEFVGRIDGQLKIRGFRIEPGEIEAALTQHPAVNTARVVARAHPGSGEKTLVAYYIPNGGKDAAPTCRTLRSYLEKQLPPYLVPPAYVSLDSLPLNANGKLDAAALPEPDASCMVLSGEQLQPRSETEKQLAALWQDVLGIESVGVEDHFFEIGGHSLLAVRLLTRIEKEFGSTLSLSTLFSAPTIAHQAELLDTAHVMETQPFSSLVPLNPGGARPRLYCIHHGYGDLTGYHDLVRRLGEDQPVYGLQARGIDGNEEPLETIEAMAAHYVAEILALQPKGPYHLTGFSLGGVIAFEMARQLQEKGHRVGLLALLDTYAPIFFQKGEKGGLLSEIASVAADLPKVAPGSRWRYAVNKSKVAGHRLKGLFHRPEEGPEMPEEENRIREAIRKVELAARRALENYQPSQYEGRAVVFRAQDHEIVPGYDPVLWWSEVITGGVEIQQVPGNHHAILSEPGVGLLAGQLRLCLNDAHHTPS